MSPPPPPACVGCVFGLQYVFVSAESCARGVAPLLLSPHSFDPRFVCLHSHHCQFCAAPLQGALWRLYVAPALFPPPLLMVVSSWLLALSAFLCPCAPVPPKLAAVCRYLLSVWKFLQKSAAPVIHRVLFCFSGTHQDNYKAQWFERTEDPTTGEVTHIYQGGYWEAKEQGSWGSCPDIF